MWDEKFKDYKKCKFDDIAEYVEKEKPEYKATLAKQIKQGKDFLTIKKAFYFVCISVLNPFLYSDKERFLFPFQS